MFNLLKSLQKREVNGRGNELRLWSDIQKHKSIIEKITPASEISMLIHRCGDFLAILSGKNQLSLFDLPDERKWSIDLPNYGCAPCTKLLVSNTGVVVYIATKFAIPRDYQLIQIFLEGKKVSEFTPSADIHLSSIRITNNRIFGVSTGRTEIYEWDIYGNLVRSLPMIKLNHDLIMQVAINDNYYVVASAESLSAFVFDLKENMLHTFNVLENVKADAIRIDTLNILDKKLIIGFHYTVWRSINPMIHILDIETGNRLSEYIPLRAKGKITNLVTNNIYIVFRIIDSESDDYYLYCVNTITKSICKKKSDGTKLQVVLDLNLNNSILSIVKLGLFGPHGIDKKIEGEVLNLDTRKYLLRNLSNTDSADKDDLPNNRMRFE